MVYQEGKLYKLRLFFVVVAVNIVAVVFIVFFCSCSYWVQFWPIKVEMALFEITVVVPRNLPLKFHQNRVSNS